MKDANEIIESIKPGVCIDIGAYYGMVSRVLALNGNRVYSIEPDSINYKTLERKKRPGMIPIKCAISNETAIIPFYGYTHPRGSRMSNSLYKDFLESKDWCPEAEVEQVQSFTMDDFIETYHIIHINFIKINCEGGEYKIFEAGLAWLNITDKILLSIHKKSELFESDEFQQKEIDITDKLIDYGFVLEERFDKKHISEYWVKR